MRAAALAVLLLLPTLASAAPGRVAYGLHEEEALYEGDLVPGRSVVIEIALDAPNLTALEARVAWDTADAMTLDLEAPAGAQGGSLEGVEGLLALAASGLNPVPPAGASPAPEGHLGQGAWRVRLALHGSGAPGLLPVARHYRLWVDSTRYEGVVLEAATGGQTGLAGLTAGASSWAWPAGLAACAIAAFLLGFALARRRRPTADPALPARDNTRVPDR